MARRVLLFFLLSLSAFARPAGAYEFGLVPAASAHIGVGCYDIKVADVNGDGRPDAVAAVFDLQRVAVVFGTASGFAVPTFYSGGHAVAVDLADYDGNGSIDILEADWDENAVRLWTNQGNGTFVQSGPFPVTGNPRDVASGDFDGNGTRDAVVGTGDGRVVFLPGLPGGGFGPAIYQPVGDEVKGLAAGDLDNDGDVDVVAIDATFNRLLRFRNDGGFPFVQVSATTFPGSPSDVALGDLDGDGFLDAAASLENGLVATLRGGALNFNFPVQTTALSGNLSQSVAIADFDGEGGPDLLVSNYNQSTVQVLRNLGAFQFGATVVGVTGANPRSAAAGDFDLDGRIDAVSGDFIGQTVKLLRNASANPRLAYSPESIDFGEGGLGVPTVRYITLQNVGGSPLVVTPGAIDGAEFGYSGSSAPITLQAGATASLGIRYERTVLGTATGTLHLASNDTLLSQVSIPLTGSTVPASPEITFAPSPLDFGTSYLGAAEYRPILFRNLGNAPVTVTPGAIEGDEFGYYPGSSSPFTLQPGGSRNVVIRCERSVLGDVTGTLHVTTTDPDVPEAAIGLLGTTVPAVTRVSYTPHALDFGTGYEGAALSLQVRFDNIGNQPLTVTPGAIDGAQFVYDGSGPPFTVPSGFSGWITIRYLRTALGDATGTLHVATNDPDQATIAIPLAGTTLPRLPKIAYAPSSLDFGSNYDGVQQVLLLQIDNVGQAALTVTPGAIDGDQFVYDQSSAPFTVPVGLTRSLPIRYLRSVTGPAAGTLHFATNDPDVPNVAIPLEGVAAPPPLASFSAPEPLTVSAGTSTPTSFVVRNTGLSPLHVTVPADAGDLAEASPYDIGTTEQEFMRMESSGAMWNLDWEGRVLTGGNGEYFWGMDQANFLVQSSGVLGLGGRELRLGPVAVAPGVIVTRKIFVPGTDGWVRYVDVAENPNETARTATFDLFDNLGYGPIGALRTSDGDAQFELNDDWIVVPSPEDRRTVGRMFRSAGATPVLASWFQATTGLPSAYSRTKYVVQLPPHGRACVIQWAVQGVDADATQATVEALHQAPAPGLVLADAIDRGSALNLSPDPKAFRPVPGDYVVAPGDSAEIAVVFGAEAATHDADLTAILRVTTDDPLNRLLLVPLAFSVGDGQVVGTDPGDAPPVATLELSGFRPNPMRLSGKARVSFRLASSEPATLTLYDVRGRVLAREALAAPRPGPGSLALGGGSLKAGVVWMRLEQGGKVATGKGIVLP